jgi:hypothetical protein
MLSFSTEFPVAPGSTPEAFVETVKAWLLASPHNAFSRDGLALLRLGSEKSIRAKNQHVELAGAAEDQEIAVSIRFTASQDDVDWVSEISFAGSREPWVSIRTFRDSSSPVTHLPPAKKPVVVMTLLDALGGGWDGGVQVGKSPRMLSSDEVDLAASLIAGEAGCYLPVVYISVDFNGVYWVDPNALARELCGMAHVICEPDSHFSQRLRLEVEPAYGGAVGIYWPDGAGRRLVRADRSLKGPDRRRAISKEVRQALLNRRPLTWCSWPAAQQAQSRLAIRALRESGSDQVDLYISTFDAELALKDAAIEAAEAEIRRLSGEIRSARQRTSDSGLRVKIGTEEDYYPNEILGILRDAAASALENVQSGGRRAHILSAIAANNPSSEVPAQGRDKLKALLRGYKSMTKDVRDGLSDLGFSISEDGKHFKVVYKGDDRYTFALPKTSSDFRAGLNSASDIAKRIF